MTKISTRLLIGTGSVGTIGGVGYLVSALTNTTESLNNYLKRNNLTRRRTGWETVSKTYAMEAGDEDLRIDSNDIMEEKDIQEWCDATLKMNIKSDDPQFKIAARWCSEFKTIKDSFPAGKTLISEASEFKNKYETLTDQDLKSKRDAVEIKDATNSKEERFKKWCHDNSNRTYSNKDEYFAKRIIEHCLK